MKHIVILGDGMADKPCAELGGQTPLEAAHTPALDRLAAMGRSGLLDTVPAGYAPGSEIAHLSLLGYNLDEVFEGRGVLEAAAMGVDVEPGMTAMRCNLICLNPDGTIRNHSAGHITTAEADELLQTLNRELGDDNIRFHTGVSYRHLLTLKGADKRVHCTPPHDVPGHASAGVMPRAEVPEAEETAALLRRLIIDSQKILAGHPVNLRRAAEGKDPANSIWPWSLGYRPAMKTLTEMFGIRNGKVISAVDLIRGLGVYAGLEPIAVEGATGLADTNYEGKLEAAVEALRNGADFVFLHIEASDEAGHEGNADLKKRTVEYLDSRVLGPLLDRLGETGEETAIAVLPDHPTPCVLRTHTAQPVPFTIWYPGIEADQVQRYSERACSGGAFGLLEGDGFIRAFLHN